MNLSFLALLVLAPLVTKTECLESAVSAESINNSSVRHIEEASDINPDPVNLETLNSTSKKDTQSEKNEG